jgi:hypothetical protein
MNRYIVKWNNKLQPIGGITFDCAKKYILSCVNSGTAKLFEFEIFDNYGQLKTNIVTDDKADPTLITSYFKVFN